MASENEVKQYLAYWFQLGKKVLIRNGQETLLPKKVIQGASYSDEFERCWQQIISPDSGECYLEGTDETIAELLAPAWDMIDCARCSMPIPVRNAGMPPEACPCFDLSGWPNTEAPSPRSPIDTQAHLTQIRDRLLKNK
ncbi:hypothetical protein [Argonema antarcticum]|uniref:hypothetical protein n=1 Tax=Argonema antarcticum TaxID=2942763 RepID=UPI002011E9D7|nr:hypothetical protein [Argonema antarcticum]MCL1475234.1 hypothetical protein [Argonema antarcticum A004/B2]